MTPPLPRVLIVDDEVNIAEFLKDVLEDNDFSVEVAYTGKDGLMSALKNPPDVILLDVGLPDTDGYSVCREMRQRHSLRNRPILMLTALNDERNELLGLRAGADDYLTKPIEGARLLARLRAAIHRNVRELDSNPLTRLPGNATIAQEIDRLIQEKGPFAVVYGDLNNFKSFNDRYGFLRGDHAIKLAAECIVQNVEKNMTAGEGPSFVGHVGGDDFVCIVHPSKVVQVCEDIIAQFDKDIPELYDQEDRERGYIVAKNRQDVVVNTPLMGIALVAITNEERSFNHPGEISSLASELKSVAKKKGKSAYVMDRRKPDDRNAV